MIPLGLHYTTFIQIHNLYSYNYIVHILTIQVQQVAVGLCHPSGKYMAGLGSGFGDRDGYTLCGEVKRRSWWCRMPTAGFVAATAHVVVDTWPAHQLICMQAQLFISSSSVSRFVMLLLTFFS